jgi:hypothetical protein
VTGRAAVTEAIGVLFSAAEPPGPRGNSPLKVMYMQTAIQLGTHSTTPRFRELKALVEGPHVGVAPRYGAALRAGGWLNRRRCQRIWRRWATLWQRPPGMPWKTLGDRPIGYPLRRFETFTVTYLASVSVVVAGVRDFNLWAATSVPSGRGDSRL